MSRNSVSRKARQVEKGSKQIPTTEKEARKLNDLRSPNGKSREIR
jgi:hypothetical protein